jgi:type VI secretion system Hcp family effector
MPDIILDVGDTSTYEGECLIKTFEKMIVCESFSVGANQPLDHGRGLNRTLGTMNLSEVSLMRQFDKSSVPLLNAMFTATVFGTVKIHFLKSAGATEDANSEFLTVELTNALISTISSSGSAGGSAMSESLSFGFTKIKYTYKEQKIDKATLDGQKVASFDMYTQISSNS